MRHSFGISEIDHRLSQTTGPILSVISPVSWSLSGGIDAVDHSLSSKTLPITGSIWPNTNVDSVAELPNQARGKENLIK